MNTVGHDDLLSSSLICRLVVEYSFIGLIGSCELHGDLNIGSFINLTGSLPWLCRSLRTRASRTGRWLLDLLFASLSCCCLVGHWCHGVWSGPRDHLSFQRHGKSELPAALAGSTRHDYLMLRGSLQEQLRLRRFCSPHLHCPASSF